MTSRQIQQGRDVILAEARALEQTAAALGESFAAAVAEILALKNYLIVVGVGKSGHIGQKLAASFASTGTPSFFMHPTEASHGDLGMVSEGCGLLVISNSGESAELRDVLSFAKRSNVPVIGMTKNADSTLGRFSTHVLTLPNTPEVCINGLAPTTSTTNTLALGDALLVTVMSERGFTADEFGARHPGGKLGLQLQRVADWMELNPQTAPTVAKNANMQDTILAVSEGRMGCVALVDAAGNFAGMITDGDLRRAMDAQFFEKTAADIANMNATTLPLNMLMGDVVRLFTDKRISCAFIVNNEVPVGVIDMKTLLQQKYV